MQVSEALLEEFSRFVEERIGTWLPQGRRSDMSRGMMALAHELHCSEVEPCMRKLMASPSTRDTAELLARHFTVGETYFFREPAVFNTLEYEVLPPLLAARRDCGKRLRIWSAGCSTGEEAYSLAALLIRLIPDIREWDITLLATDINPAFLDKARQGVYRDWSFRNLPAWIKQRYFEVREPDSYVVLPHIRQLVKFGYLNLADDTYPNAESNTTGMDIILCRNVLMYFEPSKAQQVIQRLHRSLVNGGWLIVSPAEAGQNLFSDFATAHFPDAIFYRKEWNWLATAAHSQSLDRTPKEIAARQDTRHAADIGAGRNDAMPERLSGARRRNPQRLADLARTHANLGQLDEAKRCCEAAIAGDKSNPGLRYLQAMILEEQEQADAAIHLLRQALYLDRNFVLAHFALGSLYRRRGKAAQAARYFSNATALLGKYAPSEMLPESGGITAGRLSEIIRATESVS